jgi:hypothetical protein
VNQKEAYFLNLGPTVLPPPRAADTDSSGGVVPADPLQQSSKRAPALAFISNSQPLLLDQRLVYTKADNTSAFYAALETIW